MVWASAGHYASYIQGVLPFSHIINMAREDGQAIFYEWLFAAMHCQPGVSREILTSSSNTTLILSGTIRTSITHLILEIVCYPLPLEPTLKG